jgi:DNA primase
MLLSYFLQNPLDRFFDWSPFFMTRTSSPDNAALIAPLLPTLSSDTKIEIVSADEVRIDRASRSYRVRGLSKALSAESLRITLRVVCGERLHLDSLDLYQARARASFAKAASVELGVAEPTLLGDLSALVLALEPIQDAALRAALPADSPSEVIELLTAEDEAAGLALLRDPALMDRIVKDVELLGVVGEGPNALLGYVACTSRLLDKPLAILIQSTSAAGKSTLMDTLLSMMPERERVQYSAMTGQSLFYLGEGDLQHKILAIAEEEGVRQAAYALKLLQSQGELSIASTGKDPSSGKLVTAEYQVKGPVMLCLTTTAVEIDEELLNRCVVLSINESAQQTAAIQQQQRLARTLEGLQRKHQQTSLLATHRAAQSLLRPLAVVNPFAERLQFASDRVRLRRDHAKYLTLIDAVALLHQHQREIKSVRMNNAMIEYIEVTESDITLANQLAHAVLGRSLDDLPPHTRRVLAGLSAWVGEQAQTHGMERAAVRFTRRAVRAVLGMSDTPLRLHLERLVSLEYVQAHGGKQGQQYTYSCCFDGDVESDALQLSGLMRGEERTSLGTQATSLGSEANLASPSLGLRSGVAGGSRGSKNTTSSSENASITASTAKNARSRTVLNGAHRGTRGVRA